MYFAKNIINSLELETGISQNIIKEIILLGTKDIFI
jgi:hypothetical protein